MDVLVVAIVVLLGTVPACAIERTKFDFGAMKLVLATLITVFGGTGLALMVFARMDSHGVLLTYLSASILHLVFALSNLRNIHAGSSPFANYVLWFSLLVIATLFGLTLGRFGLGVCNVYHCTSLVDAFSTLLILVAISGGISMLMIFRETKVGLAA